jgi:hypothetical protein
MKATDEKTPSYYSQELIDGAKAAAVNSKEWAMLLRNAIAAGDIDGALALKDERTRIWHTLADKLSAVAPVAVTFAAPITTFLVLDELDKARKLFETFDAAESALSEGGSHEEIGECFELRRLWREGVAIHEALTDFRLLCGCINAGIKAAQENAQALAKQANCLAAQGNKPQAARDKIVQMFKYDLGKYGLKVNLQKVQAETCDVSCKAADTDAEKAAKAIVSAFKLDPSAAMDAILKLELTTVATLRNAIERQQKAAQIETAKQDSEHKQGAAEGIADKVPDNGKPNPDTGRPNVADMVSALNADDEAKAAARRLADLKAQGTTPEIESDLAKASQKGRKVAGL